MLQITTLPKTLSDLNLYVVTRGRETLLIWLRSLAVVNCCTLKITIWVERPNRCYLPLFIVFLRPRGYRVNTGNVTCGKFYMNVHRKSVGQFVVQPITSELNLNFYQTLK